MPKRYPTAFRRKVLDLVEAGRPVAEIAEQLDVSGPTIYNGRNQDLVDRGLPPGVTTAEPAALTAARRQIRESEQENRELRRANTILRSASGFFAAELDRHTHDGRLHRGEPRGVRGRAELRRVAHPPRPPITPPRAVPSRREHAATPH